VETQNNSSLSSRTYQPILNWVRSQFKINNTIHLELTDVDPAVNMTKGWTGRKAPKSPIAIKISVPKKRKFPYVTKHVQELPAVTLGSLKEEIVLVLAHELRHAYQMDIGVFAAMQGYWSEVDAEREAIKILELYRSR
jgi:hypothetical protein